MTKMRAHLTSSDDPLQEGQDYVALCRKKVNRAKWVLMFDNSMLVNFRETLSATMICPKCLKAEVFGRYVYGLVPGGEHGAPET